MGFMDAYKNLEKLCCEIYGQPNGVSAYIDEMTETSGFYYVKGWNEDLKNLKHYRWVRNKISHEPDCSEANMCESCDTVWLECFYERIMNQSDPLTLYQKALWPRRLPHRGSFSRRRNRLRQIRVAPDMRLRHQDTKNAPNELVISFLSFSFFF